jgi:hypothetical protein
MASKYKLSYFNIRGRGEVVRWLLELSGVPYEDVRIEMQDWPKLKESKSHKSTILLPRNYLIFDRHAVWAAPCLGR